VWAQTPSTPAAKPQSAAPAKKAATTTTHAAPKAAAKPAAPLTTLKDKFSYALGMNLGSSLRSNLRQGEVEVDQDILLRGLKTALAGGKTELTEQEAMAALQEVSADVRKKMQEKMEQEAVASKKAGEAFLAANKTKDGVVTLPDGLQYKILTAGTGAKPTADDTVTCNYRGTLIDGTEFDSSYKRSKPETFPLKGVIKGWTESLQLMPVGSKWQLFIPADLAYGEHPRNPDVIPPNSTLIFEVELLSIAPKAAEQNPQTPPPPAPAKAPDQAQAPSQAPASSPAPAGDKK